uniref:Interactor of little elongation complex ELL subunit 1 n=1 Tax=Catagonus wagneri TaxID=51154 RepID=A0A8C3VK01_9CETA
MLQKISPLQKCQEELGSLKAELEEKKSSLKLYQDTHQEYARVKEECLKTDAQKKKLEAKVKKLEEAAVKQTQDFKQLRNEKKILEKEFKKTQERLDEFSKQKNEKELRHIGTQISNDSYGSIDKRKVKLLLKELWLCVNTTHRLPGEGSRCVPEKPAIETSRSRELGEDGAAPAAGVSPLRASSVQACLAELSMEIEGDFSTCKDTGREGPGGAAPWDDGAFAVDWDPAASGQRNGDDSTDFLDHDPCFDEDLQAAVDFFRLPPPLLSPVPSPPPVTSPHLGPLPPSLAPETYFGECTDSSDNEMNEVQQRNAESASEGDTLEPQDGFSSPGKRKGSGVRGEELKAQEASQALGALDISRVSTAGFGTFTATLREPSAALSFAREKYWALSSELLSDRENGILEEAGRWGAVRGVDGVVRTENPRPEPPGSPACGEGLALGTSDSCPSHLGPQPLHEPNASEGKTLGSRVTGSPSSELTEGVLADAVASESGCLSLSGPFQGLPADLEKERAGTPGLTSGKPPVRGAVAAAVRAAGLSLEDQLSSCSASAASSLCGHPLSPPGMEDDEDTRIPAEGGPSQLLHSQQKVQATTFDVLAVRSESPHRPIGDSHLEGSSRVLSPGVGACGSSGQRSSEPGCRTLVKASSDGHSTLQPGAPGAAGDRPAERQVPSGSGLASSAGPQPGLVRSGLGFASSTWWHHSNLLQRGGEGGPGARAGPVLETGRQSHEATPCAESTGPASKPERAGEGAGPGGFRAPVSLLPNQVSVITKQARPAATQSARWGPPRPAGREAPLAAYVASGPGAASGAASGAGCGEGGHRAQKAGEPAAPPGMGPGAPTSWRRLDFDSPSASSPVENSHCPTNSKLSVSSKNIPVPKQDMVTEAAVQEETHAASPCLQAADLDLPALGVHTRPAPEATLSRGFPAKETPCGDAVRSAGEALAVSEDLPVLPRGPNPPLQLPSPTPGSASPEGLGTAGTAPSPALGGADAEKRADPQSSLSAALYCYSGVREAGAGDSEGEESEAPSCSEAESEPDAALESGPRRAGRGASGEDPGAAGGGAAPRRPPVEVGHLTSALRDCSIGAPSDADRLSTSEVVTFLESCQLRDYSSGDSVSECSSKGTRNRGMDTEVKESEPSGEKYREQLCEEDALDSSEEWAESEEEDRPLRSRSALSEVLAGTGQEPQTEQEAAGGKDADDALFLNVHDSVTAERMEERVPPPEATSSESPCSNAPLPMAGSDTGGGSDHENTGSSSEAHLDVIKPVAGGEEAPTELLCPDSGAGPGEMTFQCQISTVTSEVINVLINKDQNLVIEKGENWTIINGVALVPSVDQVILCDASADAPASPEPEGLGAGFMSVPSVEKSPESGAAFQEPQGDSQVTGAQEDAASGGQSANFDKSRLRNRPVKPSVRISSEIYDQNFESQTVPSDHTYYNSKLEPFGKNKNRSKIANRDQSNKPVKTAASGKVEATPREASPSFPGERGTPRAPRNPTQTILASADTSTPADCSADTLSKIRQEVGPPLPPLLAPLIATPPRTSLPSSPLVSSSSPSSPISPLGGVSPLCDLPVPPMMSPLPEEPGHPSPCPSPPAAPASERVLSSPLQFCAATPKHALPVPGRLPRLAPAQPSVAAPQENSVKILDTMYPELSARARTLSILKGNLQLARAPPAAAAAASAGKTRPGPVCAATGFKAITSASTAFVKAGGSAAGDGTQDKARELGTRPDSAGKRTLAACPPRGAKRLRLDSGSPEPAPPAEGLGRSLRRNDPQAEAARTEEEDSSLPAASTAPQMPPSPEETVESQDRAIADALKKIAEASFDLLPVIRSHVYVGNISKKPVMRDQEKEVVYEFSTTKKHLAECLLHSILSELKLQKASVERSYGHALCRVYVGVCRQLGDLERARLFCYSLLKEDFPESEKLTLFIANMWHDVFMSQSVVSKAMQLVARQRATGEVLNCLRAFLSWEKNAPLDVGFMVSKLLLTIQLCPNTEFQSSEKSGEDLSDSTWEYISAIDLLCCHQRWVWTHDHIISKELWPVMDKWIKYRKGRANVAHTPDIIVASVLRLIGRLGQLGLKEGFPSAVKNISAVIGMFIQHARDEDIPWGIQLAAVYALCDLSPSNPEEIAKILEAWRQEASRSVPTAVLGYLEEVNALCAEGRS